MIRRFDTFNIELRGDASRFFIGSKVDCMSKRANAGEGDRMMQGEMVTTFTRTFSGQWGAVPNAHVYAR